MMMLLSSLQFDDIADDFLGSLLDLEFFRPRLGRPSGTRLIASETLPGFKR